MKVMFILIAWFQFHLTLSSHNHQHSHIIRDGNDQDSSKSIVKHHLGANWMKSLQATFNNFSSFQQYQQCSTLIENQLMENEKSTWREITTVMRKASITIVIFYHLSTINEHWREVLTEHLYLLDGRRKKYNNTNHYVSFSTNSTTTTWYDWEYDLFRREASVLQVAEQMIINIANINRNRLEAEKHEVLEVIRLSRLLPENERKIKVQSTLTLPRGSYKKANEKQKKEYEGTVPSLSEGEYATIQDLHEYCSNHSDRLMGDRQFVVYLHNKASCCLRGDDDTWNHLLRTQGRNSDIDPWAMPPNPPVSWREEMNTFILEFPSICSRALLQFNYSACGVENHFAILAGNFWWSRCSHITNLPSLDHSLRFDSYAAERFILNVSKETRENRKFSYRCVYSPLRCAKYHYNVDCHRDAYRLRLTQFYKINGLPCTLQFNQTRTSFPENIGSAAIDSNHWPETAMVKNTKYNTTNICFLLRQSNKRYDINSAKVRSVSNLL